MVTAAFVTVVVTTSAHAARLAPMGVRAGSPDVSTPSDRARARPWGRTGLSIRFGASRIALRARNLPTAGDDLAAFARVTGNDVSEVDFQERLFLITPSLHIGGEGYFFRVDAPVGLSSGAKTFGLGIYPLNVAIPIPAARLMPYAGTGVVGSFVMRDSTGTGSLATGGLFQARSAVGIKLLPGRRADLSIELGYSPWAAGAVFNANELDRAMTMFERGQRVNEPGRVLRGGAGDVWDLSLGVGWL